MNLFSDTRVALIVTALLSAIGGGLAYKAWRTHSARAQSMRDIARRNFVFSVIGGGIVLLILFVVMWVQTANVETLLCVLTPIVPFRVLRADIDYWTFRRQGQAESSNIPQANIRQHSG